MKYFIALPILVIFSSCYFEKYVLKNQQFENCTLNLLVATQIPTDSKREVLRVQIDGNNFRYYYLFYNGFMKKNDFRLTRKELKQIGSPLYKSVFDSSYSTPFSKLDRSVFRKVLEISDSLKLDQLNYVRNMTGFTLEKVLTKK